VPVRQQRPQGRADEQGRQRLSARGPVHARPERRYEALQRRGKKKMQALGAVMRKYLTGLWACLQKGEDFDSSKLFSDSHLAQA